MVGVGGKSVNDNAHTIVLHKQSNSSGALIILSIKPVHVALNVPSGNVSKWILR